MLHYDTTGKLTPQEMGTFFELGQDNAAKGEK